MATKHIYFVRHGETEGNVGRYLQFKDTKLSDAGHRGAKALAQRFEHMQIDALYASTFVRAQQTASYIAEMKNIQVTVSDCFHEKLHAQDMRGVKYDAPEAIIYKKEHTEQFWTEGWNPDGAENYFDVRHRMLQGLSMLEQDSSEHIVVVTHSDFIRTVAAYLLSGESDEVECVQTIFSNLERMSNVGISEFLLTGNRWSLLHWNDHAHFAE